MWGFPSLISMIQPGEFPEGKKKALLRPKEIHTGTLVLEARRNAGLTRETRAHSQLWMDTHIQGHIDHC